MLKVRANRIAVRPIYDPDKIGSIIVPEMAKERCDQGIVKYIGSEVKTVKPLDYVLFSGYAGTLLQLEGEGTLIILPEDFITAVVSDVPNVEVPGLYFRSFLGDYFAATYEQAMEIIARSFTESGATLQVKSTRPTPQEYDLLKGG